MVLPIRPNRHADQLHLDHLRDELVGCRAPCGAQLALLGRESGLEVLEAPLLLLRRAVLCLQEGGHGTRGPQVAGVGLDQVTKGGGPAVVGEVDVDAADAEPLLFRQPGIERSNPVDQPAVQVVWRLPIGL